MRPGRLTWTRGALAPEFQAGIRCQYSGEGWSGGKPSSAR
jgi:hypothetical protein